MNPRALSGLLLGLIGGTSVCLTQYYESQDYGPLQSRYVTLGVVSHEFSPRSSNSTPASLQIEFKSWAPALSFHQGPVDVLFAYTRYQLHGNSYTAIHFGTVVSTELPLSGKRPSALALPVCVAGDYTKTGSDGTERDNFNVGSIGIGTGLRYRYTGGNLDFAVHALGIVHFAFEGYGSGNGSSIVLTADARLLWRSRILFDGLVFGYRIRSQAWTVGGSRFDYRAVMHGPYVGALF